MRKGGFLFPFYLIALFLRFGDNQELEFNVQIKYQLPRCTLNMKRVQDLPDNYQHHFTLFQLYPIIPKQLPADSTQPEPEDGSERSHRHCLKGDLISVQTCVILSPVDPSLSNFRTTKLLQSTSALRSVLIW